MGGTWAAPLISGNEDILDAEARQSRLPNHGMFSTPVKSITNIFVDLINVCVCVCVGGGCYLNSSIDFCQ